MPSIKSHKISIIIPAYNCEATIRNTLDSVFSQTYSPYEVILVDDHSPVSVASILNDDYPSVKIIRHSNNLGVQNARNTGFEQAVGDYILFLDADDVLYKNFLQSAAQTLTTHPQIAAYFGNFVTIKSVDDHNAIPNESTQKPNLKLLDQQGGFSFYLANTGAFLPSFTVFRKTALDEVTINGELFPKNVWGNEDFHLFLRILSKFETAYELNEMGLYLLQPTSISQNQLKVWNSRVIAINSLIEIFRDGPWNHEHLNLLKKLYSASLRVYARILAAEGQKQKALKLLTKRILVKPEIKTLALIALILLNRNTRRATET
ncbi:glycosyltransferase family 2 protein [Sneathiella glossodoripedis]|uniref:glycosyltransferase family 2 protein n=1 Tax=Sneathiella glossodoripedis TaxID=418853 RepID=UPI00046F9982|nr:glycosyltransferase family 2 protein [Sneathiella glossodoripedis]